VRIVAPVQKGDDGEVAHHPGVVRRRACCPSRDCPTGSWTVYEEGGYPHRTFQLDVVASAVLMHVLGGSTLTATGAAHQCGRDSVRRWLRWVKSLAEPRDLESLCAQLDPDGMPSQTERSDGGRAVRVLWLLERLVELLRLKGVSLPRRGSGLTRLLSRFFKRFGEVFYLTKLSPPLRADPCHLGL
jgi:hypothetical protein